MPVKAILLQGWFSVNAMVKLYSQKIRVEIHGEYFQKSYLMIFSILSVAHFK